MSKWSVADTRNRVLEHLQVISAGETASAEDAALVDEAIVAARAQLSQISVVGFSVSSVPEWAQLPWRDYVAGTVASSFGLDAARRGEHEQRRQLALKQLRELTESDWNSQPVEARYY